MQPTVLAGPVEFSPAEIALVIAVLVAAFVVVTAPGWVVLSIVMGRRSARSGQARPSHQAPQGHPWGARIGGAVAGLAISVAAGSLVNRVLGDINPVLAVLGAWGACWALAVALHRPAATSTERTEGWGR